MMECSHNVMLSNQLVGIYASEVEPRMQLAAAHALYVAVDRCRDMVHVTDDQHVVRVSEFTITKRCEALKIEREREREID